MRLILITAVIIAAIVIQPTPAHAPELPRRPLHVQAEDLVIPPGPEIQLLARLIYAEARGEPFTGQVAVGAVVLNRVRSKNFPGTIEAVIYQPGQFAAVAARTSPDCLRAARMALKGQDPTQGALYFYNPDLATDTWIFTRPVVAVIGNHTFAK